MSERKVLQKYYPPDFDPSAIARTKKPKDAGPAKLQTVRLMAPFSLRCNTCGEFIYKGRKFNARKETTEQKYYSISIIRFYIRCTRCSAELTFKTDPKNNDYTAEKGMKRNFEPWREAKLAEETEEERLDRLEREEAENDAMKELEGKTIDSKTEMAIADKLDQIRTRNARRERADKGDGGVDDALTAVKDEADEERERQEREDEEAAKAAFRTGTGERVKRLVEDEEGEESEEKDGVQNPEAGFWGQSERTEQKTQEMPPPPVPTFVKAKKRKQDFGVAFGIKKKKPEGALV